MADSFAVILADPSPSDPATHEKITDVLVRELKLVRYDCLSRVRDMQGILINRLSPERAQRMLEGLLAEGIAAGVVDETRLPENDTEKLVKVLAVDADGLHAQIGYYDTVTIPWARVELVSICLHIPPTAAAPTFKSRRVGLFRLGSQGVIRGVRVRRQKISGGGIVSRQGREKMPGERYVADIHLINPVETLRVTSDACSFAYLADRLKPVADDNYHAVMQDIYEAGERVLFAPMAERFLQGDALSDSPLENLREFQQYNRWLRLAAMAFSGASQPAETSRPDEQMIEEDEPVAPNVPDEPVRISTPPPPPVSQAVKPAPAPTRRKSERTQPRAAPVPVQSALPKKKLGWSIGGWTVRWCLILLGGLILFDGARGRLNFKELSTTPKAVSVEQAAIFALKKDKHYVTIKGNLADRKIYLTGLSVPQYTKHAPDTYTRILGQGGVNHQQLAEYVGASVIAAIQSPTVATITIQIVRTDEGDKKKTVDYETFISPLPGTGNRVWAVSPRYTSTSRQLARWNRQKIFRGRLSRFSDLNHNRAGLQKTWREIKDFSRTDLRMNIPTNAIIILVEGSNAATYSMTRKTVMMPIQDSQNALFVRVKEAQLSAFSNSEITGILTPQATHNMSGFGQALGAKIPTRIGIITPGSSGTHNQYAKKVLWVQIGTGFFFFMIGSLWFMLRMVIWLRQQKT